MDDWLISGETGEPFSHCISCKLPLLEIDAPWLVNKEFSKDECILEYAICQPCRDGVSAKLCAGSKESVRKFLETEIDWKERLREFMQYADPTERFDACIACRTPRSEMGGFGISALLDSGGSLVTGPLPLLICRPCIGRMTAHLSEESRKVWKDFLTEHFEGPPLEDGFPGMM